MATTNRVTEDGNTRLTQDGATRILETGTEPAEPPIPLWSPPDTELPWGPVKRFTTAGGFRRFPAGGA